MSAKPAVLIAGLVAAVLPGLAHHSFVAEFDSRQPVQLQGVVTKVEWSNPHTYFHVEVAGKTGREAWICQAGSPHALEMRGWQQDSIKVGDSIAVEGYRARNGSTLVNVWSASLADGRKLLAASSADVAPR